MKKVEEKCPVCGEDLVKTHQFVYCTNVECNYAERRSDVSKGKGLQKDNM